jgi:hypothetical protein
MDRRLGCVAFESTYALIHSITASIGEHRPLIEAPGQVLAPNEVEDCISIIAVALFFIWDCHILTASGRDAIFVSHDEFGWFASRDSSVAESIQKRLAEIGE